MHVYVSYANSTMRQVSVRRMKKENQVQVSQAQGHPSARGVLVYR